MLEAADATYVPPLDKNWRENYEKVIENHLYGVDEDTPLIIPRKSTAVERKNIDTVTGALDVRKSVNRSFNELIAEIEATELPSDFPLDTVVTQLKSLRQEVVWSRSHQTEEFTYETYLRDGDKYVRQDIQMTLGAVGSLYTFLGHVARNLDKQIEIEMKHKGINVWR